MMEFWHNRLIGGGSEVFPVSQAIGAAEAAGISALGRLKSQK